MKRPALAALLALLVWPATARADRVVTTTDDHDDGQCLVDDCTLREAITHSGEGETVTLPAGDYQLDGHLDVTHGVTIAGDNASDTTVHGTIDDQVIVVAAGVSVALQRFTITGGHAGDGNGGGILARPGADAELIGMVVTGNQAWDGGGIYGASDQDGAARVGLQDSTVSGNDADHEGAGLYVLGPTAVFGSTVSGNTATGSGGGVYSAGTATLEVNASTISGNHTGLDGGGLYLLGAPSLVNSTVSGNTATADGGGMWAGNTLSLANVTVADNAAASGGGIQYQVDTQIATGTNNILARNDGGSCGGITGQLATVFTLSDDASCTSGTGSRLVADPKLGPLADNGGPTKTQLPLTGSEAIDNGDAHSCPGADQRGQPRPLGGTGCDIGALETQGVLRVITQVQNDDGGVWQVGDFTSRVDADDASGRAGSAAGADYALPTGAHTVTGAARGYQRTFGAACGSDGLVTVAAGQTTTCTITYDDVAGAPAGLVLESYGSTRTDFDWGLTEPFLAQTRGYLQNPAFFGPSGTVRKSWSIAPGIREANDRTLAGVDVFFTGWVATASYTADEKAALRRFVERGGTLIATTDDTGHTMVDAFGVTQGDGGGSPTENVITAPAHAIANGVFGAVAGYRQYDATGNYPSLGPFAHEIGRYASGPGTTIAVVERGALAPGSGAAILVADVDVFTDHGGAAYNATLIKNIFAFAAGEGARASTPPPSQPQTPQEQAPEPEIHKTAVAEPVSGTVKVRLPGKKGFTTLKAGEAIPLGTIVDTRKGRVTIVAAADGKGGTATADFYDGLFKIGQTKGSKPITELTLVEKLTCAAKKATAAKKKVRKRRLWGDGKGRFRTKGKHSAATVVGTKWLVQDTCTTTLTKVARGVVSVRDFAKQKTVKVKAGHKYVARAR